jgi:Mn-dependent DtxR family transcriptional regulator
MISSSAQDYLERIVEISQEKGYVRVSDLAGRLSVSPASVTNMLKKLEGEGLVVRESYRGFSLTPKGKKAGENIAKRHQILLAFFSLLELPTSIIEQDIEGLEHHISDETLDALEKLVRRMTA